MSATTSLQVGQKLEFDQAVPSSRVQEFAALTGDHNPIHLDAAYAAKTVFKQPIVHGMLTASFISRGLTQLGGEGTLYLSQKVAFKLPVKVGDTVRVQLEVTHVRSDKPIVTVQTRVFTGAGELAVDGEAVIKAPQAG
jgi:enoyl-CoA hydratase